MGTIKVTISSTYYITIHLWCWMEKKRRRASALRASAFHIVYEPDSFLHMPLTRYVVTRAILRYNDRNLLCTQCDTINYEYFFTFVMTCFSMNILAFLELLSEALICNQIKYLSTWNLIQPSQPWSYKLAKTSWYTLSRVMYSIVSFAVHKH